MKRIALASVFMFTGLLVGLGVGPAKAQTFTQTVRADTTMDGHVGIILQVAEPGFPTEEVFVFVEAGLYRVYALRALGGPWTLFIPARYYAPVSTPTFGQSWRGLDTDTGLATTATVVAQEMVTVPAGTFPCFRIDVTTPTIPFVINSYWLADGVGLVKEQFWEGNGWGVDELSSFFATGTGLFPSAVGNTWSYSNQVVPVRETTWGSLKATYR